MSATDAETAGTIAQFVRYGAVGALGTALHFGAAIMLVEGAGANPVAASGAGFMVAFVVQYLLNRTWVFASRVGPWRGLARYAVVCATGLAISLVLMHAATAWLHLDYLWGLAAVVAVVPVTNFTLNRLWTFSGPPRTR